MAIDEALLRQVTEPVLRFYRWSEPNALSIGYFDAHTQVTEQRPFVRRYTGGGLVDHTSDFTYSIVVPKAHTLSAEGTTKSYEAIHQAVTQALRHQGIIAELAPCCLEFQSKECFQKPVKYDVISGTTKLAGGAQRRTREGCLHQGSVLVPNLEPEAFQQSMIKFLTPLLAQTSELSELSAEELQLAQKLEVERYQTDVWNFSQ